MNASLARGWGLAACLVMALGSGCNSGTPGTVRGQTPTQRSGMIQASHQSENSGYVTHWGDPAPAPGGPGWNPDCAPFGMHGGIYNPTTRPTPYQHVLNHAGPYSSSSCLGGCCLTGNGGCGNGGCASGGCGGQGCGNGCCLGGNGCCLSGNGRGCQPTHYHIQSYEQPRDLVYPPANTPAAVVQYPYYTTKGPDDFFLDNDG